MEWFKILDQAVNNVKRTVTPLIKDPIAQKTYGIGAGGDPKKYIDIKAEAAIVEVLTEKEISFTLISEEAGIRRYGTDPTYCITVDPIDGTTNTLRGIPFSCTSIAVSKVPSLDAIEAAAVADLVHEEVYIAQRRSGSYRNHQKIKPAQTSSFEKAIIGLDVNAHNMLEMAAEFSRLLSLTKHIRHLGANALELCYVADGTIDAFIDVRGKLRTTDIAAATLIIHEAGAKITTPKNTPMRNPLSPTETVAFIAAGNSGIHQALLKIFSGYNDQC